jgi:amidase
MTPMPILNDPFRAFMPYPPAHTPFAADGPLTGLSFGVKDLFDVAGYRTGCGSPVKLAEADIATRHAPPVQALLNAGARCVGKTHTEELAWSIFGANAHFGAPINPAAHDRLPGGSSSGSASAVAGGLCDFSLGTDTGGSVRAPASFCGVYGLRPTHAAISLTGCMPLAPSFDVCGFFARNAAVMCAIGDVLLLPDRAPARRLMIARDLFDRLQPLMRDALTPTLDHVCAAFNAAQEARLYRGPVGPISEAFRVLQAHEAWIAHGAWIERTQAPLGPAIASRFAYARTVTQEQADACALIRAEFAAQVEEAIADGGVFVLPTIHGPAPRLSEDATVLDAYRAEAMVFLQIAGLCGLPQITIPAGWVDGAPVGLSLMGAAGSDRALLALTRAIAEASAEEGDQAL